MNNDNPVAFSTKTNVESVANWWQFKNIMLSKRIEEKMYRLWKWLIFAITHFSCWHYDEGCYTSCSRFCWISSCAFHRLIPVEHISLWTNIMTIWVFVLLVMWFERWRNLYNQLFYIKKDTFDEFQLFAIKSFVNDVIVIRFVAPSWTFLQNFIVKDGTEQCRNELWIQCHSILHDF